MNVYKNNSWIYQVSLSKIDRIGKITLYKYVSNEGSETFSTTYIRSSLEREKHKNLPMKINVLPQYSSRVKIMYSSSI